jgi:hypothetical protein
MCEGRGKSREVAGCGKRGTDRCGDPLGWAMLYVGIVWLIMTGAVEDYSFNYAIVQTFVCMNIVICLYLVWEFE